MDSSLFERVSSATTSGLSPFIPLHDYSVFEALVDACVRRLEGAQGGAARIVADPVSAQRVAATKATLPDSLTLTILTSARYGLPPGSGGDEDGAIPVDRVFVCCAPNVTLVLLGKASSQAGEPRFSGGWSLRRGNAGAVIDALAENSEITPAERDAAQNLPEPSDSELSALAMDFMAVHARAQADQQENIAKDKADLFSVLAILKAISAKRRAHDILFVFVEHISQVVQSDRCSIVRIWGGDTQGHVMASHEDASVVNKTIDLHKYPELTQALRSRQKIAIKDALDESNSEPFAAGLRAAGMNSLVVIPIVLFDQHVGSLLLRAARIEGNFTPREISFFEIVAEAASNALERAQLFESIQIANERLERLAITDGLTGLYNHRHFREHLEKEFERASRYRLPLSCLIFDVDDFKKFNDTFGHLVGDAVLKEIAARTQRCVRKSDLIARYGGEEFVVIMPQTGADGAMVEGERIREIIAGSPFDGAQSSQIVTISGGVSVLDHDTMLNAEDLLRAADQALYEAKRKGKNRIVLAQPGD